MQTASKRPAQQISRKTLAQVVHARYEELFTLVSNELRRSGFEEFMAAGIVLTGGASKVPGAAELAESVFQIPVRIGLPHNVTGLIDVREDPTFSTAVGLLLYGLQQRDNAQPYVLGRGMPGLWSRMRSWFQGSF